jgi:hypothetical protein
LLAAAAPVLAAAPAAPSAGAQPGSAAISPGEAPASAADAKPAPDAKPKEPRQTADEEFTVRVKTMEEQVNDLKEKIFRTKARLLLLQESVLGGGSVSQGAKAVLVHRNEMGSSFLLESVAYALDGAPVYTKVDVEGDLDKKEEFEIFNGRIVPGQHQIAVKLQFRGHGFGIFSYLEGYKFKVQSSYTFDAEAGRVTNVKIVAFEKGNITTDLKDRPSVRYDLERSADTAIKKGDHRAEAGAESIPDGKGESKK